MEVLIEVNILIYVAVTGRKGINCAILTISEKTIIAVANNFPNTESNMISSCCTVIVSYQIACSNH